MYVCKSLFLHSYTFLSCSCKNYNLFLTHSGIYSDYFSNFVAKTFLSEFIEGIIGCFLGKSVYAYVCGVCAAVYIHSYMLVYTCMSMYANTHMHMCMWLLEGNMYLPHSVSILHIEAGHHTDPGAHRFG